MTVKTVPQQYQAINPLAVSMAYSGSTTSNDVLSCLGFPAHVTVTVVPANGTARVEFSTTPTAAQNPTAAFWQKWPDGDVTAATTDVFLGRLSAIKVTAISGTAAYEVLA